MNLKHEIQLWSNEEQQWAVDSNSGDFDGALLEAREWQEFIQLDDEKLEIKIITTIEE